MTYRTSLLYLTTLKGENAPKIASQRVFGAEKEMSVPPIFMRSFADGVYTVQATGFTNEAYQALFEAGCTVFIQQDSYNKLLALGHKITDVGVTFAPGTRVNPACPMLECFLLPTGKAISVRSDGKLQLCPTPHAQAKMSPNGNYVLYMSQLDSQALAALGNAGGVYAPATKAVTLPPGTEQVPCVGHEACYLLPNGTRLHQEVPLVMTHLLELRVCPYFTEWFDSDTWR